MTDMIKFDYDGVLVETIGPENGIERAKLMEFLSERGARAVAAIIERRCEHDLPFAEMVHGHESIGQATELAAKLKGKYENLLIIGIGGSALGNSMLHSALLHPMHNLLNDAQRKGRPRWFVLDNVDPDYTSALLDALDLSKTLVVVTSKSGGTAETMANFGIVYNKLKDKVGLKNAPSHVVAITDPVSGFLRPLASKEGFHALAIPTRLGGRFTVLSAVGAFPAALCGIDVGAFVEGARKMLDVCYERRDVVKNPALLASTIYYLADTERGKNINVMFPYSERLDAFSEWFVQLWAESLGKKIDRAGNMVNVGQTPVKAVGATDQHAQNQLFIEGPFDKIITFLQVEQFDNELTIPNDFKSDERIGYLAGHTLNDLIHTERLGTQLALQQEGRPTCLITLPAINADTIGQLVMLCNMATSLAGEFYNINAYDQPGVELGKRITKERLTRR
ncbi:glucose-6-phosphate isomerase [bacterium]|nr:glucose-6-phosphate isomerase [bacterium]